jgi:hypothetical protein
VSTKRVVSIIGALFWGALSWFGAVLYSGIAPQGVAGYPNSSQLLFYICVPAAMVLINAYLAFRSERMPTFLFMAVSIAQFAAIPVFIVFSGGGI